MKTYPNFSLFNVESVRLKRGSAASTGYSDTKWLEILVKTRDSIEFTLICHECGGPEITVTDNTRSGDSENALRKALGATLRLIRKAQERLMLYLQPDDPHSDYDCIGDLLEMFDGPEQRAIEAEATKALALEKNLGNT